MPPFDSRDLIVQVEETTPNSPTVKVGWRLSPRLFEYIRECASRDPHILLLVTDSDNTRPQQFQVVPLSQGMTYLGLRHAGRNTIHAKIVWSGFGDEPVRKALLRKGMWEITSTRPDEEVEQLQAKRLELASNEPEPGTPAHAELKAVYAQLHEAYTLAYQYEISNSLPVNRMEFETTIDVTVPPDMFAKEPGQLAKSIANFASHKHRVDQCETRKYVILGIAKMIGLVLAAPIVAAAWIIAKIAMVAVLAFLLFIGMRDIPYVEVFDWHFGVGDFWDELHELKPSFWWYRKVPKPEGKPWLNDTYVQRSLPRLWLNPPVVALLLGLIWFGAKFNFLPLIMGWVAGALISSIALRMIMKRRKAKEDKPAPDPSQDLAPLVTVTVESGMTTQHLQPAQKTLALTFLEVKSKVCKPYSE